MTPPAPDATAPGASSFRAAVNDFAKAEGEDELRRVRAAASLAGVQDSIEPGDYALATGLVQRLEDPDPSVRASAASLLGVLLQAGGETPSTDASVAEAVDSAARALERALEDTDERVRLQATEALATSRDPRWIPQLVTRLRDPAALVRLQALSGLQRLDGGGDARIRDAARTVLDDPDAQVRRLAESIAGSATH